MTEAAYLIRPRSTVNVVCLLQPPRMATLSDTLDIMQSQLSVTTEHMFNCSNEASAPITAACDSVPQN